MNRTTPIRMAESAAIDVTPVMNMFIILIPFLVSMAVFSHLSVLEFSLPPDGDRGRVADVQELPLTVAITTGELAVTRGESILATIPVNEGHYDYAGLTAALRTLAGDSVGDQEIVIAIDDTILFEDVVACMDHCRDAGFSDIGLAGGTNLDRANGTGTTDAVD